MLKQPGYDDGSAGPVLVRSVAHLFWTGTKLMIDLRGTLLEHLVLSRYVSTLERGRANDKHNGGSNG